MFANSLPIRNIGEWVANQNAANSLCQRRFIWLRGLDLNQRPSGYEAELAGADRTRLSITGALCRTQAHWSNARCTSCFTFQVHPDVIPKNFLKILLRIRSGQGISRIGGTPVHGAGGPSSLMDVPSGHCDEQYILPWANLLFGESSEERGPVSHKDRRYSCNFSGRLPTPSLAAPRQVRIRYNRGCRRGSQHEGFEFCGRSPVALCAGHRWRWGLTSPRYSAVLSWQVPSVSAKTKAIRPRAGA